MHVPAADARSGEVRGEILRHLLCQRSHQRTLTHAYLLVYFPHQVVYLSFYGAHEYLRVEQSCRANYLLDDLSRALALIFSRRCRDIDALMYPFCELLKLQRPVIKGRREPEAIVNERFLSRSVAAVHRAHLRERNMALVNKQQEILREIIQQRQRRAARRAVRYHARIVLNA